MISIEDIRKLMRDGKYDEALIVLEGKDQTIDHILLKSQILRFKNESDAAILVLDDALAIKDLTLENKLELMTMKSRLLVVKGVVEDALSLVNACFELYDQKYKGNENTDILTDLLHIKGVTLSRMGQLQAALDCYKKGYNYVENTQTAIKYSFLANIGNIHRIRGEPDLAMENLTGIIRDYENNAPIRKLTYAMAHFNIALVYRSQAKYHLADTYLKITLSLQLEMENDYHICETLSLLVINALEMNNSTLVNEYYAQIQPFFDYEDKVIQYLAKLPRALFLKNRKEKAKQDEARELLEELVSEKLDDEAHLYVVYHLSDLLIDLINADNRYLLTKRINGMLEELYSSSLEQNNLIATVNALVIKSRLETINQNLEQSKFLLDNARMFSEKIGLKNLASGIDKARDDMMTDLVEIDALVPVCANCKMVRSKDQSWFWMDEYHLMNYLDKLTHTICPSCTTLLYGDIK